MNFEERIVSTGTTTTEEEFSETDLRPKTLSHYIGQEQLKENLDISLKAALARGEAVDHILFHGFPGLGKQPLLILLLMRWGLISK